MRRIKRFVLYAAILIAIAGAFACSLRLVNNEIDHELQESASALNTVALPANHARVVEDE